MAYHTPQFAERLRAHCSRTDLERWKAASGRAGARNLSEWVRWVLDKEAALVDAATRNPWVDRKSGRAKQLPLKVGQERKQKASMSFDLTALPEVQVAMRRLVREAEGL